ncbi:MAG: endolytic transglycosylase MltG [Propionibacteriaceae bacterium]
MLEPEFKPSPAREIAHKGKGCLAVIVALGVLLFGGYFVYDKAGSYLSTLGETPDFVGAGKASITISIPDGASLDDIGAILTDKGVIKSTKAWDKAVRQEERATSVQAGRYLMRTQMAATDALRLLINPGESRIRLQFTITEGLRLSNQVTELVKQTKIKRPAYAAALKKPKNLGLPKYAKNRPEGFFFPETYELTADANATAVLKRMVTQYNTVTSELGMTAKAKALKRKPYEVLIVASIIEREVNNPEYRAKVARVLYNRLDAGQKLQLDSTVIYAVNSPRNTTTAQDRASKSKYNTYRYKGLPPGPISAPGRDALQAALNPEKGKWLFFVTVNYDTGETKFAVDEAGHTRNVREFQAWCQANKGKCT